MKVIKLAMIALMALVSMACSVSEQSFEVKITGAEHFPEGVRVVIARSELVSSPKGREIVFEQPLSAEGLIFKGEVSDEYAVSMDVLPADSEYPYTRVNFVVEPGAASIRFVGEKDFVLKGEKYNELLVNSWNNDKDYQDAIARSKAILSPLENRDAYMMVNRDINKIKDDILLKLGTHNDPVVRVLAYAMGYFGENSEHRLKDAQALVKELGSDHRQAAINLRVAKGALEDEKARSSVGVGTVIKDFSAEEISGKPFQLAGVLKKNKYVLVEFWASWCGPCRGEIPHMKTAYKHYQDKGFEIVSFTLDDDRDDWQDASDEEGIPWVNAGDLLAYTSPVVKLYGVAGVPANYLVEASSGEIIAKDLRQEALDEKLAELLD